MHIVARLGSIVKIMAHATSERECTSYDWDITYIDAPLVRFRDVNGDGQFTAAGETVYFTWDANHNITALVDAAASGVVERYVYAPYGGVTVCTADFTPTAAAPTTDGPLYGGYWLDAETGNYLARYRIYNLVTYAWAQRDPLGYAAQDENLYRYVRNAPTNASDPQGEQAVNTPHRDEEFFSLPQAQLKSLMKKRNEQQEVIESALNLRIIEIPKRGFFDLKGKLTYKPEAPAVGGTWGDTYMMEVQVKFEPDENLGADWIKLAVAVKTPTLPAKRLRDITTPTQWRIAEEKGTAASMVRGSQKSPFVEGPLGRSGENFAYRPKAPNPKDRKNYAAVELGQVVSGDNEGDRVIVTVGAYCNDKNHKLYRTWLGFVTFGMEHIKKNDTHGIRLDVYETHIPGKSKAKGAFGKGRGGIDMYTGHTVDKDFAGAFDLWMKFYFDK